MLQSDGILTIIMVIFTLTAGSAVLMWIGERITEKGGWKWYLYLLTINIISRVPNDNGNTVSAVHHRKIHTEGNSCGSDHYCNYCCNGRICRILTGR